MRSMSPCLTITSKTKYSERNTTFLFYIELMTRQWCLSLHLTSPLKILCICETSCFSYLEIKENITTPLVWRQTQKIEEEALKALSSVSFLQVVVWKNLKNQELQNQQTTKQVLVLINLEIYLVLRRPSTQGLTGALF